MATAESCEWFQECLPLIAKDRHEEHRLGDPAFVSEVWQEAVSGPIWARRGTRPSLNRFMSLIREAKREMPLWHTRRFAQVVTCMQEGLLRSRKMTKYLKARDAIRDGAAGSSALPLDDAAGQPLQERSAEERAIRAAAQNLLVVSTLILDDDHNCRMAKMITAVYSVWNEWHSEQKQAAAHSAGGDSFPH